MPAAVSFPGMPRARRWEIEDSTIDLSKLKAHKTELGFSAVGIWIGIQQRLADCPLKLPTGCLASIRSMRLTDVFGVQTYIIASPKMTVGSDSISPLKPHRLPKAESIFRLYPTTTWKALN